MQAFICLTRVDSTKPNQGVSYNTLSLQDFEAKKIGSSKIPSLHHCSAVIAGKRYSRVWAFASLWQHGVISRQTKDHKVVGILHYIRT